MQTLSRLFGIALLGTMPLLGCNSQTLSSNGDGGPVPEGVTFGFPGCRDLACKIAYNCPTTMNSGKTTVTGVVNIPAGNLPLYGASVYVPNSALSDYVDGPTCDRCSEQSSGSPVAITTTDAAGHFILEGVPTGENIPLVVQLGKWRRELTLTTKVDACTDTVLDAEKTRLPRNQGEGHLPKIAIATGGQDALQCMVRRLGISDSEFTPEGGTGRVNLFAGHGGTSKYVAGINGGATLTSAPTFWGAQANLNKYDVLLYSCDGQEDSFSSNTTEKPAASRALLESYLNAGGRAFLSHWHHYWVEFGSTAFKGLINFQPAGNPPTDHLNDIGTGTADIDMSFAKGQAMANWLRNVQGSSTLGKINLTAVQNTIKSANAGTQTWIRLPANDNTQYVSFNTPVGVPPANQCGRAVISDLHISAGDNVSDPFPMGCKSNPLSPQEKALIFMFFDLASCIEQPAG